MAHVSCPACGSVDLLHSKKRNLYICEDCRHEFSPKEPLRRLRIFISYGHDEHAILAQRLKEDLERKGHEVWFDLERLKPGVDWESYIEEGLEWVSSEPRSGRVVLLMTPHSVRRPDGYCLNELARALSIRLTIIPVMVVWCEPPLSICRLQWLDMTDCVPLQEESNRYEGKLDTLTDALEQDRLSYEGAQSRLIHQLEPLPFEGDILKHVARFTGRKWIFEQIDHWLSNPDARRVFWIVGKPGVGKTAIASWLCAKRREIAAFHLCRYGHAQKSDPRKAVLSIAYQLSSQLPDYLERLSAMNLQQIIPGSNAATLFDNLIVEPLSGNFPRPDRIIVILIDALDEASEGNRNELAYFIASEFDKTPDWLRLIITSRPDPQVMHPLQSLTPYVLDTSSTENETDLRTYLADKLQKVFQKPAESHVIDAVISRSEGLFLYAEWICEELARNRLSLDRVEEFPQGLGGVYAHFFARQFPDVNTYERSVLPLLEVIVASREPLPVPLLTSLFQWEERDELRFLYALGSLFPAADGRIQPFHRSLTEWLTSAQRAGLYSVSLNKGSRLLADFGWNEFNKGIPNMSRYSLAYLPSHLIQSQQWDRLEQVLTSPAYIESKCAAGMTYELLKDYRSALTSLPEEEQINSSRRNRNEQLRNYCEALLSFDSPDLLTHEGQAAYPEPPPSMIPRSEEEIMSQTREMEKEPTRAQRLQLFFQTVSGESHNMVQYGSMSGFFAQQAYNLSEGGPVARAAEAHFFSSDFEAPILIRRTCSRPSFHPQRALRQILEGHHDYVVSIAVTPDGSWIVSGSADRTLRIWDGTSGQCRKTIRGFAGAVNTVAITPDGSRAVTAGSYDNRIQLWDVGKGEILNSFHGSWGSVTAIAMTPGARFAVFGSADQHLRLLNLATGTLESIGSHSNRISSVAVTPDCGIALSASFSYSLRLWNISSRTNLAILQGHTGEVTSVAMTPNGKVAVSGSNDQTLRVWDLNSKKCIQTLEGHEKKINSVALTPDGRIAVTGSSDKTLRVWDLETRKCVRVYDHPESVQSVDITADAEFAVSASESALRIWNVFGGITPPESPGHSHWVEGVSLSADADLGISGGRDSSLLIWNTQQGSVEHHVLGHIDAVLAVRMAPDGLTAISSSRDYSAKVWDCRKVECIQTFEDHSGEVSCLAMTPDGRLALSGSWDKTVMLWDPLDRACRGTLKGHTGFLYALDLAPDGQTAATGSEDRTVRIWNLSSSECLETLDGHLHWVEAVAVTPHGKLAISGSRDGAIKVWDLRSGDCVQNLEGCTGAAISVAVTPDAQWVICGSLDKTIRIWNLQSGSCEIVCAHPGFVSSIAYRGGLLMVGDRGCKVTFYETRNLKFGIPFVTPARLFHLSTHTWEPYITILCEHCRYRFQAPDTLIEVIRRIAVEAHVTPYQSPCRNLPDEAWEEPELQLECPSCSGRLRSNPFLVDNRGLYPRR